MLGTTAFERSPDVTGTRTDDAGVFTAGQADEVALTVDASGAAGAVHVRDTLPEGWSHVAGDGTERDGHVVFEGTAERHDLRYVAEAPSGPPASGPAAFGPAEYSLDGETWLPVPGTTDENVVVGVDTGR